MTAALQWLLSIFTDKSNPSNFAFLLTCYLVSIPVLPIFVFSYLLALLFKSVLIIGLKLIYGKNYVGMISGTDSVWLVGEHHAMVIDVLYIVSAKTLTTSKAIEKIKKGVVEKILDQPEKFPKLTSTLQRVCGYGYLLKAPNNNIDELVSTVKVDKNSENYSKSYEEIFSDASNEHMPMNNSSLWRVVIIDAPSEWKIRNNIDENQFPILIRLHHSVGDGVSILSTLLNVFSDEKIDYKSLFRSKAQSKGIIGTQSIIEKVLMLIHLILLSPGYIILMKCYKEPKDKKFFEPPLIGGKRHLFVAVQDGAFEKMKRIKSKIGDTSFIEVMCTVISGSLQKYFENCKLPVPDEIVQAFPAVLVLPDKTNPYELKGTVTMFRLPIPIKMNSTSLLERLKEVKKRSRPIIYSPDAKVRNFVWNYVCGTVPPHILVLGENTRTVTVAFSNVPGAPKVHACKEFTIDQAYFMPPVYGHIGICGGFHTYNDTLQIGISTDTNIITSVENARHIVPDMFENIRLMDEEVSKKY